MRKLYAIIRLKKAKNAWCWKVNLQRCGTMLGKQFYDRKHGGSSQALAAAIAWRDSIITKTPVLSMRDFHSQERSNNRSGVPGVHFLTKKRQPKGVWQAKVKPARGKSFTKTFSVKKFGERAAFRLAVAARRKMLDLVDDRLYLYHRTAKRRQ